jgi:predicted transcriptional regulator
MKRSALDIKISILKVLKENSSLSAYDLSRKARTGWNSAKNHCKELIFFGCVKVDNNKYSITNFGKECLSKIKI